MFYLYCVLLKICILTTVFTESFPDKPRAVLADVNFMETPSDVAIESAKITIFKQMEMK